MVLVPATMKLLGDANWWLPGWLDRRLPTIDTEGEAGLPGTRDGSRSGPRADRSRSQATARAAPADLALRGHSSWEPRADPRDVQVHSEPVLEQLQALLRVVRSSPAPTIWRRPCRRSPASGARSASAPWWIGLRRRSVRAPVRPRVRPNVPHRTARPGRLDELEGPAARVRTSSSTRGSARAMTPAESRRRDTLVQRSPVSFQAGTAKMLRVAGTGPRTKPWEVLRAGKPSKRSS